MAWTYAKVSKPLSIVSDHGNLMKFPPTGKKEIYYSSFKKSKRKTQRTIHQSHLCVGEYHGADLPENNAKAHRV